jgi:hypothetical protein
MFRSQVAGDADRRALFLFPGFAGWLRGFPSFLLS